MYPPWHVYSQAITLKVSICPLLKEHPRKVKSNDLQSVRGFHPDCDLMANWQLHSCRSHEDPPWSKVKAELERRLLQQQLLLLQQPLYSLCTASVQMGIDPLEPLVCAKRDSFTTTSSSPSFFSLWASVHEEPCWENTSDEDRGRRWTKTETSSSKPEKYGCCCWCWDSKLN